MIKIYFLALGLFTCLTNPVIAENTTMTIPMVSTNFSFKRVYEIQGNREESPLVNAVLVTEGVVTASFNGVKPYPAAEYNSNVKGFYIQDVDGDDDESTSDGIYVYSEETVAIGDIVTVNGKVTEFYGLTEITDVSSVSVISSGNDLPTPASITLPLNSEDEFEKYEGMLVKFDQELTVTENRNLGFYGEMRLSANGKLWQPTQVVDVNDEDADGVSADGKDNVDAVNEYLAKELASNFLLDDIRDGINNRPIAFLDEIGTVLAGSTVNNVQGIFTYAYSEYRVYPTVNPQFAYKEREAVPVFADATLKVASFNVLNYFNGDGQDGGFPTSRGAETIEDFTLQSQKIVAALQAMNADVVGLIEIENEDDNGYSAIQALTDSLNKAIGSDNYDYVRTGTVKRSDGTFDEIKNGFIYDATTVELVGDYQILNSAFDADFADTKNRPVVAQTFKEIATDEIFTVAVNHLKSKGSGCDDLGDPNLSDGQGNCNETRVKAAGVLVDWLATDPTGSNDTDFLILGDLNSYAQEDPIDSLRSKGFVILDEDNAYSYVYDGRYGTLDYALANASMKAQVAAAHIWHINSDESSMFAYNYAGDMFKADPYRSSDHDPVIVGLSLNNNASTNTNIVEAGQLVAYPIPTTGIVYFTAPVTGTIYNVLGVPVKQLHDADTVNMKVLGNGMYLIKTLQGDILKIQVQ